MSGSWIEVKVGCHNEYWPQVCQVSDPHVTLAYLGNISDAKAKTASQVMCRWYDSVTLLPTDLTLYPTAFDVFGFGSATVLKLVKTSEMFQRRKLLVQMLEDQAVEVNKEYDFTPHVTVGYKNYRIPKTPPGIFELLAKEICLMHNGLVSTIIDLP